MKLVKNIICFIMAVVLTITLAACTGNQPGAQQSGEFDDRKPYEQKDDTAFQYTEDTDGDFEYKEVEWEGPKGYVIVVPAGNSEAKTTAETLQGYFKRYANLTLSIVTDKTAEVEKEILIGRTSRADSNKSLDESKLEVSVKGKKLIFDGGHDVTVDSAVKKFTRLTYNEGKAYSYSLETDFKSTPGIEGMEDYVYVWGDEFEEGRYDDINWTKWRFDNAMSGTNEIITSKDRCVADIDDGRLQLFAINYYNVEQPQRRYVVPWSVSTIYTMAYVYGYAEIRAKVPFFKGTWPSWWGGSSTRMPGVRRTTQYYTEIDIFEIFGSDDEVVPNLHKWYQDYDYATNHNVEGTQHTASGTQYNYNFKQHQDISKLSNEYHVYGFYWNKNEMSMWVDGTKYQTFDITKSWDLYNDMSCFHDPSFLQFNNHVFSDDSSFRPNVVTNNVNILPSEYFIDYFRIYQKPGEGRIYTDTNPTSEGSSFSDRPIEDEMFAERR